MEASFVIAFASPRLDNLLQTLRFLVLNHAETIKNCELVSICQDSCDLEVYGFKRHQQHNLNVECMQLPHLTNFGVAQCTSDKIIVLESDRILPNGYFAQVIEQLAPGVQITARNVLKLDKPYTDEEIISGSFQFKSEPRTETNEIGTRNMWSGNTAFMKPDFEKAGKMDEEYKGYGWADNDMTATMEKAGVKSIFRTETELHLWHPGATYGKGDQEKMFIDNGTRFCKKWNKPIPLWLRERMAEHKSRSRMSFI